MAIALDLDQRNSADGPDLVGPTSAALNARHGPALRLPFVRTAGDEMQAVIDDPEVLVDVIRAEHEYRHWWIGVGVGTITRVGAASSDSAGPVFVAARAAVEAAKRDRDASGPAVRGEPAGLATALQAALAGITFIRSRRTTRQREVVRAVERTATQRAAAERLGVTPQAVSDALGAAGHDAERQLRRLAIALAADAIAL